MNAPVGFGTAAALGSFFQKPGVVLAIAFILLYRFDEAQLAKVISPFLLDSREGGGLGLTTSQVGLAYGTFGILALTCGGLLGGFSAAKHGLKPPQLFMPLRMLVAGTTQTPSLDAVLALLPREAVRARIAAGLGL